MGLSRKRAEAEFSPIMKKRQKSSGGGRGGGARGRGGGRGGEKRRTTRYDEEEEQHGEEFQAWKSEEGGEGLSLSRKRLDPSTKSYFLEIAALVKDGGNEEERENICVSALEETKGQELQLACDPGCGRVLETLLSYCDVSHIVQFLQRCSSVSVSMAVDPGASHSVEGALKSVARALIDDTAHSADWFPLLESTLSNICQELGAQAVDVMCNRYGSHVFRCLLSLLSGETADLLDQVKGGAKQTRNLGNKLGSFRSKDVMRPKGLAFPKLLKNLVRTILHSSKGSMAQVRADMSGGPVLQGLLKALQGNQEAITQAVAGILDCEMDSKTKEGSVLENAPVEDIVSAMEDRSSSHLMEVIIQSAPNPLYVEIFQRFFRKRLLKLSLHPSANFVVQVLISCARHEGQINMIFDELEGNFTDIIFEKRAGVLAALLSACGRFHTKQREACRALAVAINSNKASPVDIVPRLLHLESAKNGAFPPDLDSLSDNKMSVIGSVILQTILTFPKECSQQFCSSIAALEAVSLLHAVRDQSGSRVLEAFLESSAAPPKHKHRIIAKFEGHFAELALHPISCFTVEKCYTAADIKLKEKIAAELVTVQAELTKSRHGARISRRCDIIGYTKRPEQWRTKESTKQTTQKAFAELFSSVSEVEQPDEQDEVKVEIAPQKVDKDRKSTKPKISQNDLDLEGPMAQLGFSFAKRKEDLVPLGGRDLEKDDTGNGSSVGAKKVDKPTDDIDRLFGRKNKEKKSKKRKHSSDQ